MKGKQDYLPGGVGPERTEFGVAAIGDGDGGAPALDESAGSFRNTGAQSGACGHLPFQHAKQWQ